MVPGTKVSGFEAAGFHACLLFLCYNMITKFLIGGLEYVNRIQVLRLSFRLL
jgi:hypothetical protein